MLLLSFVKINPPLRKKNDLMILFCLEVLKIPPHPKKKNAIYKKNATKSQKSRNLEKVKSNHRNFVGIKFVRGIFL